MLVADPESDSHGDHAAFCSVTVEHLILDCQGLDAAPSYPSSATLTLLIRRNGHKAWPRRVVRKASTISPSVFVSCITAPRHLVSISVSQSCGPLLHVLVRHG